MLNAIMHVWNEEDIIASTIRHAYAQGCSNVFIIDNGSTDNTVHQARRAGAHVVASYTSDFFDESKKIIYTNASIQTLSNSFSDERIWWLIADADEFATPSSGGTISNLLKQIPQDVRAIHGYLYDHIPTHPPYFIKNIHPADMMPLCSKTKTKTSKIPLVRYDKDDQYIFSCGGAHTISCEKNVNVLSNMLDIHHFQYRAPETSFCRLSNLVKENSKGISRVEWMDQYAREYLNKSRSMYHERYECLNKIYAINAYKSLKTNELSYNFAGLVRWYDDAQFFDNINGSKTQNVVAFGIYLFFKHEYDRALCQFYEAFNSQDMESNLKSWILIKIAECFKRTDDESYIKIVSPMLDTAQEDIKKYIFSNIII